MRDPDLATTDFVQFQAPEKAAVVGVLGAAVLEGRHREIVACGADRRFHGDHQLFERGLQLLVALGGERGVVDRGALDNGQLVQRLRERLDLEVGRVVSHLQAFRFGLPSEQLQRLEELDDVVELGGGRRGGIDFKVEHLVLGGRAVLTNQVTCRVHGPTARIVVVLVHVDLERGAVTVGPEPAGGGNHHGQQHEQEHGGDEDLGGEQGGKATHENSCVVGKIM